MNDFFSSLMSNKKKLLYVIILFAFLARLLGVSYGLPLWLIDDEPPFVLGVFKMIELKTLLPAFHLKEFQSILYYPPFLSYLYLIPFVAVLGIKFIVLGVPLDQFSNYIALDLSVFFIIARFINIVLGTISVYLVYKIAVNIFKDEFVGLSSAFFLATSLLHISLSMTGRHWLPASFIVVLAFWFLTNYRLSERVRYLAAAATISLGLGVSTIVAPAMVILPLWYLFEERRSIRNLFGERKMYIAIALLSASAIFVYLLYPGSFGFKVALSGGEPKHLIPLILSPFAFLKVVAVSEPVLILFSIVGLGLMLFRERLRALVFLVPIFIYSAIFYMEFRYEHRFTLVVFPFLAVLAGYGLSRMYTIVDGSFYRFLIPLLMLAPILVSARFSYLAYGNDSRILAREWTEENIAGSKVLVYARLMRLSSTPSAIEEQGLIDPGSLRKVDMAENALAGKVPNTFHALNLYSVENDSFYSGIKDYVKLNSYKYLVLSTADLQKKEQERNKMLELVGLGTISKSFAGVRGDVYTHAGSNFTGNPFNLFFIKEFGPPISIYKFQ